ncbi:MULTISPECIES: sigma-70 family RNA polymerase sigma factor [Novosphingobium]|uniref:RNA polymerase sigma-70 factor, ECF subfamily n=1 Tax=Novosphingobium mathurense TaxID=428990 RepID=A0A1U6HX60_9SPHN
MSELNTLHNAIIPHLPVLRQWLLRRIDRAEDVDDVVQDVWMRLCRLPDRSVIENPRAYLFRTASSVVTDRFRRSEVRAANRHDELTEVRHPVEEITPERVLMGKDEMERIVARIGRLPERTRDIFVLSRFENLNNRQIAAAMCISVSAVEKHMMKAMRTLLEQSDD